MTMLEKIKKEQPEMFETMQSLAMIIVIADRLGEKDKAKNAGFLFDCCMEALAKENIQITITETH